MKFFGRFNKPVFGLKTCSSAGKIPQLEDGPGTADMVSDAQLFSLAPEISLSFISEGIYSACRPSSSLKNRRWDTTMS